MKGRLPQFAIQPVHSGDCEAFCFLVQDSTLLSVLRQLSHSAPPVAQVGLVLALESKLALNSRQSSCLLPDLAVISVAHHSWLLLPFLILEF